MADTIEMDRQSQDEITALAESIAGKINDLEGMISARGGKNHNANEHLGVARDAIAQAIECAVNDERYPTC